MPNDETNASSGDANNTSQREIVSTAGNGDTSAVEMLERRRKISEIAKNAFEVIGGSIAGIWVLIAFGLKDCPNRETHFEQVKGELVWSPGPTPETCRADWTVAVKNISSKSVDINHVEVNVWPLELPVPRGDKPGYLDFQHLRPTDPRRFLSSVEFDKSTEPSIDPFVDHYSPNSADTHGFEWIFNRPSGGTQPKWIGLELVLYENKGAKNAAWYSYDWSELCPPGETKLEQTSTRAPR